jgi:hypothetical protein
MLNKKFIPELFLDFRCTALDVGKDLDIHSISCPCMVFRCQGIVLTCITIQTTNVYVCVPRQIRALAWPAVLVSLVAQSAR